MIHLWRLCVLYIHGGIYLDVKFLCVGDFRLYELLDSTHFALDSKKEYISNGLMVTMPSNPLLMDAIQQIVQNVSTRNYCKSPLHITGPKLLIDILKDNCDILWDSDSFSYTYNRKILEKYRSYYSECSNYYTEAWRERRVYKQNTLMLIAHPDDEILFGYNDLINASNLMVVCFTNGNNSIRSAEFYSVLKKINAKGIMLNYNDSLNDYWPSLTNEMCLIHIPQGKYECVVSHNGFGEYGHKQHIRVNSIARFVANSLKLPFREFRSSNDSFRDSLLHIYVSQKDTIDIFRDWGLKLYK